MNNNQRYFGGPSSNLQYSAPPGDRGKDYMGSDQVGPNDPIFNPVSSVGNKTNDNDADRNLMSLPKDAKPPGARFDPVTPLANQPAGPNKDEPHPSD